MSTDTRTGLQRIADERNRQLHKLGWNAEHDDEHDDGSLAWAAVCYAAPTPVYAKDPDDDGVFTFRDPFPHEWVDARQKRSHRTKNLITKAAVYDAQRLRLLEKAGALIAAEIDRLLREAGDR